MIEGSADTEFDDVAIEKLLGRESIAPLSELLAKNITGKTVLVTGAGGSIGSELAGKLFSYTPNSWLYWIYQN